MSRSFAELAGPDDAIGFAELLAGVDAEVEALVHRLPAGVDLIERGIADGADLAELDLMLDSLPDAAEVEELTGALDNPAELTRLLAARDAEVAAHAVDRGRKHAD